MSARGRETRSRARVFGHPTERSIRNSVDRWGHGKRPPLHVGALSLRAAISVPNGTRLLALPLFPAQEVSSQGSRHCPFFPHRGHVPRCVGGLLGGGWTPYQRWTAAALRWAQHWRLVGRFDSQEGELYRRGHSDGSSFVSRECLAPDPTRCDTVLGERELCNPYLLLSNRWRFSRAQTCLITRPAGDRWSCSDKKKHCPFVQ